ncbi:N2,N2-dimethylguanosine tRNA methyltransferase [Umbelopsis sp. AD052]|nr:N2,N2-dimethylguanosine tRNA methyltransferase [Umbelopsis sp. AD052]
MLIASLRRITLNFCPRLLQSARYTMSSTGIDQTEIDVSQYNTVTEGKATILFPKNNEVFYNPVQEFNRDMSIAAITTWSEIYFQEQREKLERKRANKAKKAAETGQEPSADDKPHHSLSRSDFTILEALAATGLRSVRYAKEIPNVKRIVANDLLEDAVLSIKRNTKFNEISEDLLHANQGDALGVMYNARGAAEKFDVIDLDPYGTAAPFIDGAVQSVTSGGLLCVTCTDLAVLTGSMYPETCFSKYGGMPLRGMYCHEMALRLVLNTIQTSAARYGRYIEPLASCSIDFYVRLFIRVYDSPAEVKKSASKIGMVYDCNGCNAFVTQPLSKLHVKDNGASRYTPGTGPTVNTNCENCEQNHRIGGPTWVAPIHNKDFVSKMLQHVNDHEGKFGTSDRMKGMLSVINEELDQPFYWTLGNLCGTLHCNSIPMVDLCSAILNAGYKFSSTHCQPEGIKTDAPASVMWDIMKGWVKKYPVTMKNIGELSPARKILAQPAKFEADFTRHQDAIPPSRHIKLVRYQVNPTPNWGPKARAGKPKKEAKPQESKKRKL